VSSLYGPSPSLRATEWAPGANDFLEALTALGYRAAQLASGGRPARKGAAKAEPEQPPEDSSAQPPLLNIALLLRLLTAVCQAKVSFTRRLLSGILSMVWVEQQPRSG